VALPPVISSFIEVQTWQWHQVDHLHQLGNMQIICTSVQTDNITNTSSLITGWMFFLTPNQQCQSTEGNANRRSK